ncbi:MAG: lipoprotein [Pseudomonadota bacterium]
MLPIRQILVTAAALAALVGLGACGQKGPLFLPTPPAGVERATLPQVLRSSVTGTPAPAAPAASSASAPGKP